MATFDSLRSDEHCSPHSIARSDIVLFERIVGDVSCCEMPILEVLPVTWSTTISPASFVSIRGRINSEFGIKPISKENLVFSRLKSCILGFRFRLSRAGREFLKYMICTLKILSLPHYLLHSPALNSCLVTGCDCCQQGEPV